LGRWLLAFMSAAGIDSQIFKARSVRGASTTAAPMHSFLCRLTCQWPTGILLQLSEHFIISHCLTQTLLLGSYPQSRSTCNLSYSRVEF